MNCNYCNSPNASGLVYCIKCGAPLALSSQSIKKIKYEPFYFHGFMIWPERDIVSDLETYHIWEGTEYCGHFSIDEPLFRAYQDEVGEGESIEPILYKLLRLALGHTDEERFEKRERGKKYIFVITRLESEETINARKELAEIMAR